MRYLLIGMILLVLGCRRAEEGSRSSMPVPASQPVRQAPVVQPARRTATTQAVFNATDSLEDKVIAIVSELMKVSQSSITRKTSLADLKADSLDVVELVMELEDRFEISIPDEDVEGLKTIGQIIDYVTDKTHK